MTKADWFAAGFVTAVVLTVAVLSVSFHEFSASCRARAVRRVRI